GLDRPGRRACRRICRGWRPEGLGTRRVESVHARVATSAAGTGRAVIRGSTPTTDDAWVANISVPGTCERGHLLARVDHDTSAAPRFRGGGESCKQSALFLST